MAWQLRALGFAKDLDLVPSTNMLYDLCHEAYFMYSSAYIMQSCS